MGDEKNEKKTDSKDCLDLDLREYIDLKLSSYVHLKEYFESKLNALEKATRLAADNIEIRLEGMNEWRGTIKDQNLLNVSRTELEQFKERIDSDIRFLRESKATLDGKASNQSVMIGYVLSALGILLGAVSLITSIVK